MYSLGNVNATLENIVNTSLNAVQSNAVRLHVDQRGLVKPYDRIASTSGELRTALEELEAQGYGTVWISGEVPLPAGLDWFEAPISIRGLVNGATLVKGGPAAVRIGSPYNPFTNGSYGRHAGEFFVSGVGLSEHTDRFACNTLNATSGDWVLIFSDEYVSGGWHNATTPGHPAEMHQIRRMYIDPGQGVHQMYVINGFTADAFVGRTHTAFTTSGSSGFLSTSHNLVNNQRIHVQSTSSLPAGLSSTTTYFVRDVNGNNFRLATSVSGAPVTTSSAGAGTHTLIFKPRVVKIPMITKPGYKTSNIVIDNLTFKGLNDVDINATNLFSFSNLDGIEVRNCVWTQTHDTSLPGPSWMGFDYCANAHVHDNIVQTVAGIDGSAYFVVAAIVNGLKVSNNIAQETRHFFTTGGDTFTITGDGTLNHRIGTPLRVMVDSNLLFSAQNSSDEALNPLDTHAEGWGIVFANNVVISTGRGSGLALASRARRSMIINNVFWSDGFAGGIQIRNHGCIITNNMFYRCLASISVFAHVGIDGAETEPHNVTISNNSFIRPEASSSSGPIWITGGSNHVISHNTFRDSDGWIIRCQRGHNHKIIGNTVMNIGTAVGSQGAFVFDNVNHAPSNLFIADNTFYGFRFPSTPFFSVIYILGGGNNHRIMGNKFVDCDAQWLISITGGTGHRISMNDLSLGHNLYSINTGSLTSSNVTIIGNAMDGYSSNLGLSGTNAASIASAYSAKNWT